MSARSTGKTRQYRQKKITPEIQPEFNKTHQYLKVRHGILFSPALLASEIRQGMECTAVFALPRPSPHDNRGSFGPLSSARTVRQISCVYARGCVSKQAPHANRKHENACTGVQMTQHQERSIRTSELRHARTHAGTHARTPTHTDTHKHTQTNTHTHK